MNDNLPIGSKVYYTGDMANGSGWFTVASSGPFYTLKELPGGEDRTLRGIYPTQIGSVYRGHCNPRFVTETAYRAFQDSRQPQAHRG
jgi:hypothetical protein